MECQEEFNVNKEKIKQLPQQDLEVLKEIKKMYDINCESIIPRKIFKIGSFYDDEEEFDHFYSSWQYDVINDFQESGEDIDSLSEEDKVLVFGTFLFAYWDEETKYLIYYDNKFYSLHSEGYCNFETNSLAMFPLEGLWANGYDYYKYELVSVDEENFNQELREFLFQDWSIYENFLKKFNINLDLSKEELIKKFEMLDEDEEN